MSKLEIIETINKWIKSSGIPREIAVTVDELEDPPAVFGSAGAQGEGALVVLATPNECHNLQMWVPFSNTRGATCTLESKDVVVKPESVDWMEAKFYTVPDAEEIRYSGPEALGRLLQSKIYEFLRDRFFALALRSWFARKGWEVDEWTPDITGFELIEANIDEWCVLQFKHPQPDYPHSNVVAVSGEGEAAILVWQEEEDGCGCWTFEGSPEKCNSAAELHAWLDKSITS